MKAFLGIVMAAALTSPALAPALAAPAMAPPTGSAGPIVLAAEGCGRDYHRDRYGNCRPNWREWERGWRACPRGYHLGSQGRRCWPN
jgi:hypothetical protein